MRNLVVIGMKGSGKTTLAHRLARKYDLYVCSLSERVSHPDHEIAFIQGMINLKASNIIVDATEYTPLDTEAHPLLSQLGPIVLIDLNPEINFQRVSQKGIPDYETYHDNPRQFFDEQLLQRMPRYKSMADITLRLNTESEIEVLRKFINLYEH